MPMPSPVITPSSTTPKYNLLSAADLMALSASLPPVTWLWEKYLPLGRLVLLAAYPKVGKSTLVYPMALAIARGLPFLGYATTKNPVLFLALEEHVEDVLTRLKNFGMTAEDQVYAYVEPLRSDKATLEEIERRIEEKGIKLLVIDTLSVFWAGAVDNENDNAQLTRELVPLRDLTRRTNCTVLLIHHEKKGGEDTHGGRMIRGGSAIVGNVDHTLQLDYRNGGSDSQRVLKCEAGRYSHLTPRELVIELDGNHYRRVGTASEVSPSANEAKVLGVLSGGPMKEAAVVKESGLSRTATLAALRSLVKAQKVIKAPTQKGPISKVNPYTYRLSPGSVSDSVFPLPVGVGLKQNGIQSPGPQTFCSVPVSPHGGKTETESGPGPSAWLKAWKLDQALHQKLDAIPADQLSPSA